MFLHAATKIWNCLLIFTTLGSAYQCASGVSDEECLAKARAFSAELLPVFPQDVTPAQALDRAAEFTCAPTVPAAECLASASAFSACLTQNNTASNSSCFGPPSLPNTNITTDWDEDKPLPLPIPTPIPMTAPALLPQAAQFTCAPTVPAAECLASSSAFSACLAQNITASDCFNRTQNTANLTTQAPDPTPTTPSPPILTQPGYAPCTLTSPGSTNVIILDECPPDLPQPLQTPLLPPTVPVIAGTGTGTDEGEINLLPTPTDPRVREMETPTGSWTTCVQNNLLTCNNALCTSDPNYAPRCTDTSPPRKEGRNLCIDGLPNRCQGSDCVFINETQGTSDSEETDMKTNPQIDYEGGICKGWVPPAPPPIPIPIPARPANNLVPTKTCAGPGVGRPRENGLGVVESGEERVWAWQNGDCYS